MTATERAKRSDALYYETVSVTRRVLCDMIANREADLEDAKAENEHMRLKALAVMGELQEESERLKAENAKLRELVRDMWRDIPKSESCGWDASANCCSGSDECKGECAYWYRMHELGIEADDGTE